MKKDNKEEDPNRPKRQRGRPRKIKIINDDLVPNSNQNSEDESSESDSDSSEYSSTWLKIIINANQMTEWWIKLHEI